MQASTKGFTIIEVLMAILLLSIIVLLVLGSLTGLFGLSRTTTKQVDASSRTQAVMEEVRGQWLNQNAYDRACLNSATDLKDVTISLQDEDSSGKPIGSPYKPTQATDCQDIAVAVAAGATVPATPLRSITVKFTPATPSSGNSSNLSELVLEVSRP